MLWIREHEPQSWNRIRLFLTPNQYLVFKFTGEVVIDRTSAGNLGGLFDMKTNDWSDEMLDQFGFSRSILPERIVNPTDIVGHLTPQAADSLLLVPGIPVCAGCIDCLSSTLSSGIYNGDQKVAVLATSLNWGLLHSTPQKNPKYITMPYLTNDHNLRYTYGGISTAGALTKWFALNLAENVFTQGEAKQGQRFSFTDLEEKAEVIPAGSEGLIILPYFMGERTPIWDSQARGTILGLTVKHTRAHIYRALLESVGYALRHVIESYNHDPMTNTTCRIVGGGTVSKLWVQTLADITGIKLECMTDGVEAPIGDAFMAGIATGVFTDFKQIDTWAKSYTVFCPNRQNNEVYNQYFEIYKHLYPAIAQDMHQLATLGFTFV